MSRLLRIIALVLVGLMPLSASARTKGGVTMPDTIQLGGKKLVLNGLGIREATFLNIDVYVAGLYLEHRTSDANAILNSPGPKRLALQFVRDVDRSDIVDAWKEGFDKNAGKGKAALTKRIAQLCAWMSDVKTRDQLVFSYVPDKGLAVSVKGVVKGTIEGADFARAFFAIWLGPHPPNQGLKDGLLGST